MVFIVLGLLCLFATPFVLGMLPRNMPVDKMKNSIRILGIVLLVAGILSKCVVQIDAGYVGVQKLFGKVQKRVLGSGLNLVNPFVQVNHVDVKTQNYTMSGVMDEGDKNGDDAIRVLTKDGLEVIIDLSILYKVSSSEAPNIVNRVGMNYIDKIIRPVARAHVRSNAVYYDAVQLYSTKREEFQNKIFTAINNEFKKRGFILENLLVRNISLPNMVKNAIEEKISAEQEAQKMQFVLQKEQQEAERKRIEAKGIVDYQKTINEGLTERQLQYEQIKAYREMATSKNAKMIIIPNKTPVILDGK